MIVAALDAGVPARLWPVMRCTATTPNSARHCSNDRSDAGWRWPEIIGCRPAAGRCGPTCSPRICRPGRTLCRGRHQGPRFYSWATCASTQISREGSGCCDAATIPPVSWPATGATHRGRYHWVRWSESPVNGGRSRSPSRPRTAKRGWMSTRSAGGVPVTAGAPLAMLASRVSGGQHRCGEGLQPPAAGLIELT